MTRARAASRRINRNASEALASLTDLDRQILQVVSDQRVLTQSQLERLLSDTPDRTLRYRSERLYRLGLLGRSRPYRDRGSAPYHHWPTRRCDTLVRGAAPARGGERSEPNPLFLAHAAGLSELYVLLATQGDAADLHVRSFRREREAREPFVDADGRRRALAPDALLELCDGEGSVLLAHVELDLGTMSHARLKVKASGYAAYASTWAWSERHAFCPCLLFLTPSEPRAIAFLKTLSSLLGGAARHGYLDGRREAVGWFTAGACAMAHTPERALVEDCWDDLSLAGGGLTLLDCLRAARAPYDAERVREQAQREALERERARLRSDPDAWRTHLREKHLYARSEHFEQFGKPGARALELLLARSEPMDAIERAAFAALARQLHEDPLEAKLAPAPVAPSASEREAVAVLVARYREAQRARVAALVRGCGEGPRLRAARRELEHGGVLDTFAWRGLEDGARGDQKARAEQERLRLAYLQAREREARLRRRDLGLAARLRQGRAATLAQIDRERLRVCPRCEEIAYPPEPRREGYRMIGHSIELLRCHFCGAHELERWDELRLSQLEGGGDSTSPRGCGVVDDPANDHGPEEWRS